MKKATIYVLVFCLSCIGYAQGIPNIAIDAGNTSVKSSSRNSLLIEDNLQKPISMLHNQGLCSPNEHIIGVTWFDLASNAFLGNRFYRWDDGTMAGVWMHGVEIYSFPDRGTGYNFYNGSSWAPLPNQRIEDIRCGWPSLAAWESGGEMIVAHNGVSSLEISQRTTKGSGSWTQTNFLGPAGIEDDLTWPRIITSGANNEVIHMISNSYTSYMGQYSALLYSRSVDGGASWDPHNIVLPGTGETYYNEIGADEYVMAAYGNTVCILCGSAWYDLFYMRSDDNGDTWNKVKVWDHPYPFFDFTTTITDTFFCLDNSAHITIDNQGHTHVVFGISRVLHDEEGVIYEYFPFVDGIAYWNDMMPMFSNDLDALAPPQLGYANSEMIEDVNYIGWMQDVDGDGEVTLIGNTPGDIVTYRQWGASTMPTITVDEHGYTYLLYSSTTETYETNEYNYKHIWARGYDPSTGWGDFLDVTSDIVHIFDECVYPIVASTSDNSIHYIYQADISPGIALDDMHAYQENRWTYGSLPKTDLNPDWPNGGGPHPEIVVSPTSMLIYQLTKQSEILSIQNLGSADLTIFSIDVDYPWLLTSAYPSTPFIIAAGNSQNISVDIDWGAIGTSQETATITITSNDTDEPSVLVPITAVPGPYADLTIISQSTSPNTVLPGEMTNASCEVHNIGQLASDTCSLKYYLSSDNLWSNNDVLLGVDNLDSISIDSVGFQYEELIIPAGTVPGSYFILFFADADSVVVESIEDNNVAFIALEVNVSPYLNVDPSYIEVNANQGYIIVSLESNVSWQVIEYCDWLNCYPSSGQNNGSFTVSYEYNYSGELREYTIGVNGTTVSSYVTLVQDYETSIYENSSNEELSIYPNPFTSKTTIEFELQEAGPLVLNIYNHVGELIDVITQNLAQGKQKLQWGPDDLQDGLYYFSLEADGKTRIGKIVKLK